MRICFFLYAELKIKHRHQKLKTYKLARTTLHNVCNGVNNLDLIKRLSDLLETHNVKATWVKAHTNRKDKHSIANRIVDYFAQKSASEHHQK